MIRFEDVYTAIHGQEVLRGLSFEVPRGQALALMGPSGVGKSFTLKHVVGLCTPDAGRVVFDGEDLGSMSASGLSGARSRTGLLFQEGALMGWLDAFDNVALPLREVLRIDEEEVTDRVGAVLGRVGMEEHGHKLPNELSGGMRKRVGLARALVHDPEVLLLDEPNAGLDPGTAASINELVRGVQEERGMTTIVVTHRLECARRTADRVGLLGNGRLLWEGVPADLSEPGDPALAAFLGAAEADDGGPA